MYASYSKLSKELKNSIEMFKFFINIFQMEDAYIIFQEGVDNFEIEHKTC